MTHPSIPIVVIAILLFISGSATFYVPETLNQKLLDTLDDVNTKWSKNNNNNKNKNLSN